MMHAGRLVGDALSIMSEGVYEITCLWPGVQEGITRIDDHIRTRNVVPTE